MSFEPGDQVIVNLKHHDAAFRATVLEEVDYCGIYLVRVDRWIRNREPIRIYRVGAVVPQSIHFMKLVSPLELLAEAAE